MVLHLDFGCLAGPYELTFWFLTLKFLWFRRMNFRVGV